MLHVPSAAASESVQLTAVLGRDAARTEALASSSNAQAFTDLGQFLAMVDIVGFAVPPDVQGELALRAAA